MAKLVEVPKQCSLANNYGLASYQDCFSTVISPEDSRTPALLFQDMMSSRPYWVRALMVMRNGIVRVFGLKTASSHGLESAQISTPKKVGQFIGFFKIVSLTESEVVVTANDRHLDSSFSLLIDVQDGKKTVYMTSVVQTKERFGDLYMWVVAPFHRLIVRTLLNQLS